MLELQALTEELITLSADYYNHLVFLILTAIDTLYFSISHIYSIINCIFFSIMDERKYVPYFLFFMVGYIFHNVVSTLKYLCKGQVIL